MNKWFVIPITKEEFVKGSLIFFWALPVFLYLTVVDEPVIFVYWIFPAIFTFFFKDIYDWDWHIKVKFFEGRQI